MAASFFNSNNFSGSGFARYWPLARAKFAAVFVMYF
jgi:hypothetical protein